MAGIKCDVCGQNEMIAVDGETDMFKCAYCGTKYSKEQLQERLIKIDGPIKIDGAIQVEGVQNLDKLLENGETFLNLEKYEKASNVYTKLINEYPQKYESWYGYVKCHTYMNQDVSDNLKTAKKLANEYEKNLMLNEIESIANTLRKEDKFDTSIAFSKLLINYYSDSYKGWYGYVLTKSSGLKNKVDETEFNSHLKKALDCAKREGNLSVVDNLTQYEEMVKKITELENQIAKNLTEIDNKKVEIKKFNDTKSSKIGDSKALTEKNKQTKKQLFNDFKNSEMSAYQKSYLEKTTTESDLEIKKVKHKKGWKLLIPSIIKFIWFSALLLLCLILILGTITFAFSGVVNFILCLFIVGPILLPIAFLIWENADVWQNFKNSFIELSAIPEVLFGGFKIRAMKRKITLLQKDMDKQQSTANINIEVEQAQMNKVLEDLQKEYDKNVQEIVEEYQEKINTVQKEIDEIVEKNKSLKDEIAALAPEPIMC